MRRLRVKLDTDAYYHVTSRCALKAFLLDEKARDTFVKMMRKAEKFSGVEIVTYCVMSNHFHILVKVPARREVPEEELRERIVTLYGDRKADFIFKHWEDLEEVGRQEDVVEEQDAFRNRMYDLSEFVKTLKQRYSLWYCSNHGDIEGTIWQSRFHSVLVENSQIALTAVSAYIDLNGVRANLVSDPRNYAWCGYGAALAGDKAARRGIASLYENSRPQYEKLAAYRDLLESKAGIGNPLVRNSEPAELTAREEAAKMAGKANDVGATGKRSNGRGEPANKAGTDKQDEKAAEKRLALRVRNASLSRGVAFGSEEFVLGLIASSGGDRSRTKALPFGLEGAELRTAGRRLAQA